MTWKRGPKVLSVIQQGEPFQSSSQNTGSGKQSSSDGSKSFGKKVDPALAYLHGPNSGRASASEASSGRNSMEGPSRPKVLSYSVHCVNTIIAIYFCESSLLIVSLR